MLLLLSGVAGLVLLLTRDDQSAAELEPATSPAVSAPSKPTVEGAVRLVRAAERTAGIGTGWPDGEAGAVSAAAAYTTAGTLNLELLRRRLVATYADDPDSAAEVTYVLADAARRRANLGVPPDESPGPAKVVLEPEAVSYRVAAAGDVAGYVLVRRQLVTYGADHLPTDLMPVPFVISRQDDDWKLTADAVTWPPPTVPNQLTGTTAGGWRVLLPAG